MASTAHKSKAHKFIFGILGAIMLMTVMSSTAFASQEDFSVSYDGSFTSAWQKTASNGNGASITYGYNTWLTNEDYSWAKHTTYWHWAEVTNANGNFVGWGANPGSVSKKEVTHSGTHVAYYCCFS